MIVKDHKGKPHQPSVIPIRNHSLEPIYCPPQQLRRSN
ncbi:hypothetical protein GGD68_007245 [Paraburkholderia fungorum]|uniref:Uncharacterized protein n=1 Tax=Paraburkholderia fungorum TaxID=134537 RepID=A0AAW3V639_9BURK|nr:hypothetical protein [Paraburkholderia fungorum]MBB6206379.1 hypothetical protein [Paraburkholderia fungorum]